MRVVCEGRVRSRRNALVHVRKSTTVSIFLAQARVPGGDRGARPISLLAMKLEGDLAPHRQLIIPEQEERRVRVWTLEAPGHASFVSGRDFFLMTSFLVADF